MDTQGLDGGGNSPEYMAQAITKIADRIISKNTDSGNISRPISSIINSLTVTKDEKQFLLGMEKIYENCVQSGELDFYYEDPVDLPEKLTIIGILDYCYDIATYMYAHSSGEIATRIPNDTLFTLVSNAYYLQNTDFILTIEDEQKQQTRIIGKSIGHDGLNGVDFAVPFMYQSSSERVKVPAKETEAITGDSVKNLTEEDLRAMPKEKLEQVRDFINKRRDQYFAKYNLWSKQPKELTELQRKELEEHLEKLKQKRNKKAKKQLKELYDNNKLTEKEAKKILAKLEKPMENPYQQRDNWVDLLEEEHPTTERLYRMINDIWKQRGFATTTIKILAPEEIGTRTYKTGRGLD